MWHIEKRWICTICSSKPIVWTQIWHLFLDWRWHLFAYSCSYIIQFNTSGLGTAKTNYCCIHRDVHHSASDRDLIFCCRQHKSAGSSLPLLTLVPIIFHTDSLSKSEENYYLKSCLVDSLLMRDKQEQRSLNYFIKQSPMKRILALELGELILQCCGIVFIMRDKIILVFLHVRVSFRCQAVSTATSFYVCFPLFSHILLFQFHSRWDWNHATVCGILLKW